MAHEVESMYYTGDVPWHGLGTKLENPPTIEDAIHFAGLDWEVERKQLFMQGDPLDGADGFSEVPAFANVRSTDKSILGIVGPTYRPLQNLDAFKWFQPFLDSKDVTLETAGSLRHGKHVWILARVQRDPIEIVSGDEILSFILLSNSHDGTRSVRAGFTAVRCVCANTVAAAHSAKSSKLLKVRHTDKTVDALEDIREAMKLADREFVATTALMKSMANKGVDLVSLKEYVRRVFEPKLVIDAEVQETKLDNLMKNIIPLFQKGRGNDLPGVKDTMWAAYNSVTEFLTWERGHSADTRLENLWLGDAANLAQRAFDVSVAMVG
jgi:phage/plasmid-like protein (TIGR03299 family)